MHTQPQNNSVLSEIKSDIEDIRNQKLLFEEIQFSLRANAIDFLDFHVVGRIEGLLNVTSPDLQLLPLKTDALKLKQELENLNELVVFDLKEKIKNGNCKGIAFSEAIQTIMGPSPDNFLGLDQPGYDNLDILIDSILAITKNPEFEETKEREADMVFYQKTPARIVLELAQKAEIKENDVFYDLGSGLGQVPVLINVLTGAKTIGVEFEPQFCKYAIAVSESLNLKNNDFINLDARAVNYDDGMVFYLYTPFKGDILKEVLVNIKKNTLGKSIKIFTYGPCTDMVARENWLSSKDYLPGHTYRLTAFHNSPG